MHTRRMIPMQAVEGNLPDEMLRSRAGVFVSIHKNGALRGCIGTISPVCGNVAEDCLLYTSRCV